jgi:hypothetical protein
MTRSVLKADLSAAHGMSKQASGAKSARHLAIRQDISRHASDRLFLQVTRCLRPLNRAVGSCGATIALIGGLGYGGYGAARSSKSAKWRRLRIRQPTVV